MDGAYPSLATTIDTSEEKTRHMNTHEQQIVNNSRIVLYFPLLTYIVLALLYAQYMRDRTKQQTQKLQIYK